MKKINSIGYGGKIIGAALVFVAAIPLAIRVIQLFYKHELLSVCARVSFIIGIAILLFLVLLLSIEFHQDKQMGLKHEAQRSIKQPLKNGLFECQACGNQAVKQEDKNCGVCGILFRKNGEQDEKN